MQQRCAVARSIVDVNELGCFVSLNFGATRTVLAAGVNTSFDVYDKGNVGESVAEPSSEARSGAIGGRGGGGAV